MQEKELFVLSLHFRHLDHMLPNFGDVLFCIQSCFASILCISALLIWEKQRNLSEAFTGLDRVMEK